MEKIKNLITKADFVGIQLKPTLNGNNRIKSILGGFISIVVMLCISFGFGYFSLSIIRRDKPIVNVAQEMRLEETVYNRQNPFMIAIFDRYGKVMHMDPEFNRAIQIQVEYWKVTPDPETVYKINIYNGKTKVCSKEDMDPAVYNQLVDIDFAVDSTLCVDPSTMRDSAGNELKEEINIRNKYGRVNSNYIYYKLVHCDEQADPGCGDFLKKHSRITLNYYSLDYYVDQNDYENPVKPNITATGYLLSKAVRQSIFVPTRINEIVTDSSFFLTDERKETYYSSGASTITVGEYESDGREILEIMTYAETIINVNQRRYLKVPEMLANMGGFMKDALAIGNLLSYLYSDYIYYSSVTKLEVKDQNPKTTIIEKYSDLKSSVAAIQPSSKVVKTKIPSFFEYIKLLLIKRKELNRQNSLKYLELNYLIDSLLFVEELKKAKKRNNLVNKQE